MYITRWDAYDPKPLRAEQEVNRRVAFGLAKQHIAAKDNHHAGEQHAQRARN